MKRLRIAAVLLSALLLVSVALNLVLYNRVRQFYRQIHEVRLDPLERGYFPAQPEPLSPPQWKRALFFGDSRAQDWPAPGVEAFQFVNRGISNQTSVQALERFDDHVAPLAPDVVIVQAGINDLKTLPLFPERRAEIVAACQANVARIVSRARGLGATVILATIFPPGEVPLDRRPFWSDDVAEAIDETNAYLRTLEGEDVLLLDSGRILAGERGIVRPEYSRDLLHLTAAGYEALNRELARLLAALAP